MLCYGDLGAGKSYIKWENLRGAEERELVLISCGPSSLVPGSLGDWAIRQKIALGCFLLDSAIQKEQPSKNIPGSLVGAVSGVEMILEGTP